MKKILILATILFAISFVSCVGMPYAETQKHENQETAGITYTVRGITFHVVEIDSCEYLISSRYEPSAGYGYLSHKGNCKYCAERRKRELQNLK